MQKVNITLAIDDERLRALEFYLKKENATVQKKMDEAMARLYEQTVPEVVREFMDGVAGGKPKRPAPAPKTQAESRPKPETRKEDPVHEQP